MSAKKEKNVKEKKKISLTSMIFIALIAGAFASPDVFEAEQHQKYSVQLLRLWNSGGGTGLCDDYEGD